MLGSNGLVWYSIIYIAPLNSRGPTEALLVRLAPQKRQVLRSDKEVERLVLTVLPPKLTKYCLALSA